MVYDNQHRIIKIASIVYGIDPRGEIRILMRHNKPYDGKHPDEWTFVWGSVEEGESLLEAAQREAIEEFGKIKFSKIELTGISNEYVGLHGASIANYAMLKVEDIEIPIVLNEESIGYDWMLLSDAVKIVRKNEIIVLNQLII